MQRSGFQDPSSSTCGWRQARHTLLLMAPILAALLAASVVVYIVQVGARRETIVQEESRTVSFQRRMLFEETRVVAADLLLLAQALQDVDVADDPTGATAPRKMAAAAGRLMAVRESYASIRWIGEDGRERMRVDDGQHGPARAPPAEPPDESGSKFVREVSRLASGTVHVSALERHRSPQETAAQRTLRFGTPLDDPQGARRGALILDHLASGTLRRFVDVTSNGGRRALLLSAGGDYLRAPEPTDAWELLLPERPGGSFALRRPIEWETIRANERGQFETATGLFTYDTVRPVPPALHGQPGDAGAFEPCVWKIVSVVPREILVAEGHRVLRWVLAAAAFVALMFGVVTWRMATAQAMQARAEWKLREGEAKVRGIIESASDAIVTVDASGRIASVNPAGVRMFGYQPEEIVGRNLRILMGERHSGQHDTYLSLYRATHGRRAMGRVRGEDARRKNGALFPVDISLSEFTVGGKRYFTGILRDVTDRKIVEQELRLAATAFETHDSIVVTDSEGVIQRVNPAFTRITGFAAEEVVGQTPRIRKSGKHGPEFYRALWDDLVKRGYWDGEIWNRKKTGEDYLERLTITAVRDTSGRTSHYVAVGRDVTRERKALAAVREYASALEKLNADLDRANERLTAQNRELDDFTSIASHDLQEPLRKLTSFSDLLEQDLPGDLPAAARTDLEYIRSSAGRMQRLIQDLLKLSRAGRSELALEVNALDECVDMALLNLDVRVRETDAVIRRDALPAWRVDRTLVTLLFQNLIGNALKFVRGTPEIRVTCEDVNGKTVFGVRDNGIGIAQDAHDKIFSPFRRLNSRDEYEGSGIGLAICRKAVSRHDGTIWVESAPEEGAHFRFTLDGGPSAPSPEAAERQAEAEIATLLQ